MHWIHTCVTRNIQNSYPIYTNHAPSTHLQAPKKNFPRATAAAKILTSLNQF